MSSSVHLARSRSTLRLFTHAVRKLIYHGPSSPDSLALFLHAILSYIGCALGYTIYLWYTEGKHNLGGTWKRLLETLEGSANLMIYVLLSVWLMGFSMVSLFLYWKYERDEVCFADDVIIVDKSDEDARQNGVDVGNNQGSHKGSTPNLRTMNVMNLPGARDSIALAFEV